MTPPRSTSTKPRTDFARSMKNRIGDSRRRLELLDCEDMRNIIERARFSQSNSNSSASTCVVTINLAEPRFERLDRLFELYTGLHDFLEANWAHESHVGWIADECIGIVLPNTNSEDANQFASRLHDRCGIPVYAIEIWSDRQSGDQSARGSGCINHLFVKPTPWWKRSLDVIGASLGLLFFSPAILLACLLIRLTSRGPSLFVQERIGLGGRTFNIYKLRTMVSHAEDIKDELWKHNEQSGSAFKMRNDPRVTSIGWFLRKTSLDELPQFINVLKGDMSLVGPRPLPASEWKPHVGWHCRRHDVAPGLTCYWQVGGRSEVDFNQWMRLDARYVDRRCLMTDIKLLLLTIPAVLTSRGAS